MQPKYIACDLSSKVSISALARIISQNEKAIDMLIYNAGICRDPPIPCNVLTAPLAELKKLMWSVQDPDWEDTFRLNTTAHYFLSVAFLHLLAVAADQPIRHDGTQGRDEGRGVMVITISCASMHDATNVDLTSYATSKVDTDHLVRLLAAKYNWFYVRVVGINLGCKEESHQFKVGREVHADSGFLNSCIY